MLMEVVLPERDEGFHDAGAPSSRYLTRCVTLTGFFVVCRTAFLPVIYSFFYILAPRILQVPMALVVQSRIVGRVLRPHVRGWHITPIAFIVTRLNSSIYIYICIKTMSFCAFD